MSIIAFIGMFYAVGLGLKDTQSLPKVLGHGKDATVH